MAILLGFKPVVLNAYAALVGEKPGFTALNEHLDFISTQGVGLTGYKAALESFFDTTSDAVLASALLTNLGLSGSFTQAQAEAFLAANAGNRVSAILDLAQQLYSYAGSDVALIAAKTAYAGKIDASNVYSSNPNNLLGDALGTNTGETVALTIGLDKLVGTAMDDSFVARTIGNVNTLDDGDSIDGGAGVDTVYADFAFGNGAAITPVFKNVETVVVRAQQQTFDSTNGNNTSINNNVQIDAQRSLAVDVADHVTADVGVTRWESNNSRSDVTIEDVRIGNAQKTSDVTIAMVETDPGNVDYAVYFDQLSLRNASSGTTTLTIQVMDTGATGNPATAATPLLNNPYDTFKLAINGELTEIALDKTAVAAADTYEALVDVFNAALAGSGTTASLGANFTITDPISGKPVTGKSIVLLGGAGIVITAPEGSGWFNTTGVAVPPTSNIFTTFTTGSTNVSELVTSKVVLDDVGRGSTGGDLVIGGQSTGVTSISRGVERFEITVNDNSKLQTINSTNNALREVTIVNGETSSAVADAFTTTVVNEGDLTVNGGNNISGGDSDQPGVEQYSRGTTLVGNAVVAHQGFGSAGFTDVRLIDASAFKGKLAFTAAISSDAIPKYITAVDTAANPAADVAGSGNVNFNVKGANFIYTGGNDNDTMVVSIDGNVAGSRSTVVSGLSDFTFDFNGGAGNDAITLTVIDPDLAGGAQAWYNNQKLNANIAINGGDGNDTIKTLGAGDVKIDAGAGDDLVYTDNTGALGASANANASASAAAVAYTNAAAAELAAAQAAKVASNTTGFVTSDGVAVGTFITPAAAVAALATLDAVTPTNPPALPVISHLTIAAATATAAGTGAISLAQKVALDAAYNAETGGVVTPAIGIGGPSTLVGNVAVAGAVTAAELAAGDALLATIVAAAKATAAAAAANDDNSATQNSLLNGTQLAVVNATAAVNGVEDPITGAIELGTATKVAGLAALHAALVNGTTQAAAVAAIDAATASGVLTGGEPAALLAAVGVGAMDAADAAAVTAILAVTKNTAALADAAAQAALATAIANDVVAVNTAASFAAADPAFAGAEAVAADAVGSVEAAAAATAAATASAAAAADLAASQAINTALTGLKTAVNVGSLDADVVNALNNANAAIVAAITSSALDGTGAVVSNPLAGGAIAALLGLAGVPSPAVDAAEELAFDTGALGFFNANSVDSLVIANTVQTDALALVAANAAANMTATALASTAATAAAASGTSSLNVVSPKAVYVFDTTNQTTAYNRVTQDDRNLADLKSDANNSYNYFNSTVKVTYKGLDASVILAGTGFKTSDLELNQAIKLAINTDPVLKTLLSATDGPANTLVVTSLIDGVHATADLAVSVTLPTTVTAADLAGAITAYGLAAGTTEAALLTVMTTAKTAFDAKGDYVTQFAESGAAAGNTLLVGANSLSSSDNTVTPGSGNDVIVLGTTESIVDKMSSSNEKVVYAGLFGNDTIVHFDVAGNGIDTLDFSALNGLASAFGSLSADKSIVVGAPVATALTDVQIAALFTDSATAINHVYVAVDTNNVGSVWQVADAAGTAAGNVVATLVGSIDLADTAWGTLTAANFA